MSFYEEYQKYKEIDIDDVFARVTENDVLRAINKESLEVNDFAALLSVQAGDLLERVAQKANEVTRRKFGKVIHLYAPLYLSSHCENECVYCGFRSSRVMERKTLVPEEIEKEAEVISKTGIRHILILTGESRKNTPLSYIVDSVKILSKYFSTISIEIYPLTEQEYKELVSIGVDGLVLYQEAYNEELYKKYHVRGLKRDFEYRLLSPERAGSAKMRTISIGALLGLAEGRKEIFFTGLQAAYLLRKYSETEISVSFPRLKPQGGTFTAPYNISDKELVQFMLAIRLFLPGAGINISTRESSQLRSNLIGLGVTRMSAGSITVVGGYANKQKGDGQFTISDKNSVEETKNMIISKGYQPVMKDWQTL
ncbi:MAG: 2-iminoacetate synthase ThiH [Elusimicrobia bacterium]|nr:2-iminoacetate synthase ThiH [Elusimicrobiota bacterium]